MLTEIVDIEQAEGIFLKNFEKFPNLANKNPDDLPSCFFEEELFTLDEFRAHFEKRIFERLGIKLDLSPENLASFE
jgi:hypothetical protein